VLRAAKLNFAAGISLTGRFGGIMLIMVLRVNLGCYHQGGFYGGRKMKKAITLVVLIGAIVLFAGCAFRGKAGIAGQPATENGVFMTRGFSMFGPAFHPDPALGFLTSPLMRTNGIMMTGGFSMFGPSFHPNPAIGFLTSPMIVKSASWDFQRNAIYTPMLRSQSLTPGFYTLPFSGLWPAIRLFNPARWFMPFTTPGGMH
jgi:hypothetical protein